MMSETYSIVLALWHSSNLNVQVVFNKDSSTVRIIFVTDQSRPTIINHNNSHDQPIKLLPTTPLHQLFQPRFLLAILANERLIRHEHDTLFVFFEAAIGKFAEVVATGVGVGFQSEVA